MSWTGRVRARRQLENRCGKTWEAPPPDVLGKMSVAPPRQTSRPPRRLRSSLRATNVADAPEPTPVRRDPSLARTAGAGTARRFDWPALAAAPAVFTFEGRSSPARLALRRSLGGRGAARLRRAGRRRASVAARRPWRGGGYFGAPPVTRAGRVYGSGEVAAGDHVRQTEPPARTGRRSRSPGSAGLGRTGSRPGRPPALGRTAGDRCQTGACGSGARRVAHGGAESERAP